MCSVHRRTGEELGDIQSFERMVLWRPSCEFLGFGNFNLCRVCSCFSSFVSLLFNIYACSPRCEDLFVYMACLSSLLLLICEVYTISVLQLPTS